MSRRKHAIEAHFQSGLRLFGSGRLAEAEQAFRRILAATPHADSLHMLGVLALQTGRAPEAVARIDQAIALNPTAALYHVNRANALRALGQTDAALACCQEALQRERNCAEAYQLQGHILSDLGRPADAVAAYREALRHNPALPGLHDNLGLALRQVDRPDEAATALQEAVRRDPRDGLTKSNLAGVLKELGRLAEAETLYREALAQNPADARLHFNLALVLLLAGRFVEGWSEYEWRFQAGAAHIPPCAQPRWAGEPLAGRTLLIQSEQGFGDAIQFCRFIPQLAAAGRVFLEAPAALRRLLGRLPGIAGVVAPGEVPPSFDVYCPMLSLPRLLHPDLGAIPYLAAEAERVAQWRDRLGPGGFKIGIAWQGNPASQAEHGRSIPLKQFLPLAQLPWVRLVSLQKHHGLEQLATSGLRLETLGDGFDGSGDGFIDTAAVMQCLDLVVTSDTAVAHLAGALGRPVWLALQHVPDWRWMLHRPDTPWYPTMRLFRQKTRGDWASLFAEIARELAGLVP